MPNLKTNELIAQRGEVLKAIQQIQETYEGIENEHNTKKIYELNMRQAELTSEKSNLGSRLICLDNELNKICGEIVTLSGSGIDRILEAIKNQRWYFFKNKPKLLMDRDTGILWPNFDYFKGYSSYNGGNFDVSSCNDRINKYNEKCDNGFKNWVIPTRSQFVKMIEDKSFPYQEGSNYRIIGADCWFCVENSNYVIDLDYLSMVNRNARFLPCNTSLQTDDYEENVSALNKVYTEKERLQFTLNLFVKNNFEPIFNDPEITQLYRNIYIEKPALIQQLNGLQEQISSLQQVVLLSSTFDYNVILQKYDIKAIDNSIIKYCGSIVSFIDDLMDKLHYYEEVKGEIIRDFNVICLNLSKKYDDNPNLTDDENRALKSRQDFFKKHFDLGMNAVNSTLLAIKKQAEDIEDRIDVINSGETAIKELAVLEKEERASFGLLVENAANIIRKALLKIEFFEDNKRFATNAVVLWNNWTEDYKVFKTTLKDDLKNICEDDGIENEVYIAWYDEWQKTRCIVEERFSPLIDRGLKGRLVDSTGNQPTVIEKVISMLQEYKDGIDKFYLEERKNIYQKYAFQAGGDLQEKFEVKSELYKLVSKMQKQLQEIIFSLGKSEDRLFLLKWADVLLDYQVDEVLFFIKNAELSKISLDVLTDFADLKRKNFDAYISDSKAYSEELQRREKEYTSLIFKMRKDLMKP